MSEKKWPAIAQILIALGCIGSLATIVGGLTQRSIAMLVFGAAGLVVYWNFYNFQWWAWVSLNILLSLTIIFNLLAFFIHPGLNLIFIVSMCIPICYLFYFNSAKSRQLLT